MKTVLCAFNARYSHSCLAIRYIKEYNSNKNIELAEFSINDGVQRPYAVLLDMNADIYCFSIYIWNVEITLKVAQMLKKAKPHCTIVAGGPECSYCAEDFLNKYPFVDYVVMGEGEEVTGKLIESLEKGSPIDFCGIASKSFNRGFAPAVDLCKVKSPYTLQSLSELENKIIYFETSRGCPFGCSYCLSSTEKGVRYFPMEYVKKGFDLFFEAKVPLVKLVDRTFNSDPDRAKEIIKYIMANSTCTRVHFEIDPAILTDELLDLLSYAPEGLFQLEMGIQSANADTLKAVNRHILTPKVAENISRLRQNNNMHLHLDLIAGLPYEDYETFGKSFDYVYSLKPDMLQLGFLKVLHGTPIEKEKSIICADFPPYEVISTEWLGAKDICKLKLIDKAVDAINNSGAFKRTLDKLIDDNAFKVFEHISQIFDTDKTLSRFDLYSEIYDLYGDDIRTELLLDYIENSPNRPMPRFAQMVYPPNFKKNCNKLLKEKHPDLKPEAIRFEPLNGDIYMMDYQSKTLTKL